MGTIQFHTGDGTRVRITPEEGEGQTLFAIKIDGFVTWPELEALCFRLHPPGLSALGHATLVRDATPWLRGPAPEDFDDDAEYAAALVAEPLFPLVDEDGWAHSDALYVACPVCGAGKGSDCCTEDDDGAAYNDDSDVHQARLDALAAYRATP